MGKRKLTFDIVLRGPVTPDQIREAIAAELRKDDIVPPVVEPGTSIHITVNQEGKHLDTDPHKK